MQQRLFRDDFGELPVGPLPTDWSAKEEYHFLPPPGQMGAWHEPIRSYQWRGTAPWLVVEDEGRHLLLGTIEAGKRWPRILVAGDDAWRDVTVTVRLRPLKPDGFAGFAFRYRTGRSHYRIGLDAGDTARLLRVDHEEVETLAEREGLDLSCERTYELRVQAVGARIAVSLDGKPLCEAEDDRFEAGRVALFAETVCLYESIEVIATEEAHAAFVQTRDHRLRELDELRTQYPKPVVWKRIDTPGFGTARHIRFGHLTRPDRLDMVLAQNLKLRPGSDDYGTVRCLTALDLDGNVLWQFGEPSGDFDAAMLTADVPVQVYDIDGDGLDEVLCLKNFTLYILDGRTGDVQATWPLPADPKSENHFGRLVGDAVIIANLRGLDRPRDILVKNRYRQLWAYDDTGRLLWTRPFDDWSSGHFAQPYDFDGDGRDEVVIGYGLLGPDGEVHWEHRWPDHTDEIAVGPFDPDRDGVQIALACGDDGFIILSPEGEVLHRELLGHAQRLSAARFRDTLPGLQFYVVTYWGWAGIVSFHDCRGARQFELEPAALGTLLSPVNWTGHGTELALTNGSAASGGMLDGHGRRVVLFPDDGHPDLCADVLDLTGDPRDEIVLWDPDGLWIYTQDRSFDGVRCYRPRRYPHHNASNYRAEISLPAWEDRSPAAPSS
ncbi:MAG: hypothetical protein ACODAJ_01335 [Planctomycetota bacterium]